MKTKHDPPNLCDFHYSHLQDDKQNLNFDECILEAAKSIATASSVLIKAASAAQKELVSQGKVSQKSNCKTEDGQWSEGLVSAAKMVAAATNELCDAANTLVKGISSEEKLISAAQQVASSTAQLVLACKVKADRGSEKMKGLESASRSVRKATDTLIKSAKEALSEKETEEKNVNCALSDTVVGRLKQVTYSNYIICLQKFNIKYTTFSSLYSIYSIVFRLLLAENSLGRGGSKSSEDARRY